MGVKRPWRVVAHEERPNAKWWWVIATYSTRERAERVVETLRAEEPTYFQGEITVEERDGSA